MSTYYDYLRNITIPYFNRGEQTQKPSQTPEQASSSAVKTEEVYAKSKSQNEVFDEGQLNLLILGAKTLQKPREAKTQADLKNREKVRDLFAAYYVPEFEASQKQQEMDNTTAAVAPPAKSWLWWSNQ